MYHCLLWSAIKSAIGSDVKASQIQSLEIDGEDITDPKQISASFASFFKSIIANLRQTLPVPAAPLCSPQLLTGAQFSLSQITVDFVYKQLKALNSKKSSGLPDIPVRLVKDGAEALARPLTLTYEQNDQLTIFQFPIIHSVCPPNFA